MNNDTFDFGAMVDDQLKGILKSAAEVAAWMEENKKRNTGFGTGAFDNL